MLTLQYSDKTTEATAHAYIEERQRHVRSQQDAARLLLTRAILGESNDETVATHDAAFLGLDFSQPHAIVTAVSIRYPSRRNSAHFDLVLARLADTIDMHVPGSVTTLVSSGLVVVVPPEAIPAVEAVLRRTLPSDRTSARFRVGVGTGWAGVSGLHSSYQEAGTAITLGGLLHPEHLIHRYTELLLFDLFKSGNPADRFVQELLGPILALDERRQQRALETLRELFHNALNRKQTARRLGVHQNTLTQRLTALEQLLGGRLDSGEFCFRLQLALHLLPLVEQATNQSDESQQVEQRRE